MAVQPLVPIVIPFHNKELVFNYREKEKMLRIDLIDQIELDKWFASVYDTNAQAYSLQMVTDALGLYNAINYIRTEKCKGKIKLATAGTKASISFFFESTFRTYSFEISLIHVERTENQKIIELLVDMRNKMILGSIPVNQSTPQSVPVNQPVPAIQNTSVHQGATPATDVVAEVVPTANNSTICNDSGCGSVGCIPPSTSLSPPPHQTISTFRLSPLN